mmetsp:Transcript_61517/g.181816  ORF Transcript_61517/g.181816 Transcript_61517/m.181816 type:complete len:202 (+) Transcript_61517:449-1054(+)
MRLFIPRPRKSAKGIPLPPTVRPPLDLEFPDPLQWPLWVEHLPERSLVYFVVPPALHHAATTGDGIALPVDVIHIGINIRRRRGALSNYPRQIPGRAKIDVEESMAFGASTGGGDAEVLLHVPRNVASNDRFRSGVLVVPAAFAVQFPVESIASNVFGQIFLQGGEHLLWRKLGRMNRRLIARSVEDDVGVFDDASLPAGC